MNKQIFGARSKAPQTSRWARLRRRQVVSVLLSLALIAPSLAYAQSSDTKAEPVLVGLSVPLSPPGDPASGQLMLEGTQLGVEYVNTVLGGVLGGRKLELAVEDAQGQAPSAVTAYRRLATEKQVPVVLGYYHSSTAVAVGELVGSIGTPIIVTMGTAPAITEAHNPLVFRTVATDQSKSVLLARLMEEKGFTDIVLFAENTDFGIGITEAFGQAMTDLGVDAEITYLNFDPKSPDYTTQMLQIKAIDPDVVIAVATANSPHLILNQGTTQKLFPETPLVIASSVPSRANYWDLHPTNGVGPYFILFYSPRGSVSDSAEWAIEKYRDRTGQPPGFAVLNSFGSLLVAAQAIDAAGSTNPAAVAEELRTGEFQSWSTNPVKFPQVEGVGFQNWGGSLVIAQMTEPGQSWDKAPVIIEGAE